MVNVTVKSKAKFVGSEGGTRTFDPKLQEHDATLPTAHVSDRRRSISDILKGNKPKVTRMKRGELAKVSQKLRGEFNTSVHSSKPLISTSNKGDIAQLDLEEDQSAEHIDDEFKEGETDIIAKGFGSRFRSKNMVLKAVTNRKKKRASVVTNTLKTDTTKIENTSLAASTLQSSEPAPGRVNVTKGADNGGENTAETRERDSVKHSCSDCNHTCVCAQYKSCLKIDPTDYYAHYGMA